MSSPLVASPIRVALFTGNYNHIADGVSRTLNRLVAHLEKRGVPALVFGPTVDPPRVQHAGEFVPVPSIPIPGRPEYRMSLHLSEAARERLERFDPTVVHVATPDLLGLRARGYAREQGLPLVATYHTHFSSYLPYYRLASLEEAVWSYLRWFYRPFDAIWVPSRSMAEVLEEHGIDERLGIWPRGVETAIFSPEKRSVAWRRAHGFGDEDVIVSFVSRLVWEKGLGVYASVMERLRPIGNARSLVVGDGPAREALTDRLPEAVFTGHLESVELSTAYASSDILLFPSDTETFGNVTLEAMASGIPPVCADATGSKSLIEDGVSGRLVKPGDADAFAAATEALVVNRSLRETIGAAARVRALGYDWGAVLDQMIGNYGQAHRARSGRET